MASRILAAVTGAAVLCCLAAACGPGRDAAQRDSLKDIQDLRRMSQFSDWAEAPHPLMRRLRKGWPSLEELDGIAARGADVYAQDESSRLTAALNVLFNPAAKIDQKFEAVCLQAAREKWSEYRALSVSIATLQEVPGTRAWVEAVDSLVRPARGRVTAIRERRSATLRVLLVDHLQEDTRVELLALLLAYDE